MKLGSGNKTRQHVCGQEQELDQELSSNSNLNMPTSLEPFAQTVALAKLSLFLG